VCGAYFIRSQEQLCSWIIPISICRWRQKEGGKPDGIKILGSSIHSVSEAQEAERLGADYLTAGHIYATDCKAGVPPRGLDFLEEVCQSVQIPVYGIGGVRIESGQLDEMMARGAAGACVMSGMMQL